jgi:ABC-2 type transport system ATP-binding protein
VIVVENLTKQFASTLAVDNVSFKVEQGEILGFLGPNGAGKTTTMRIITCFMPATSGRVTVDGFDVFTQSLAVRQRIGYMPENTPLYPEMRVSEYLNFRARLKGVPRKERRKRIADQLDQCAITDVQHRIIGQLSKGYRQRVGLAEALLHDSKVLILDEPTIGLDPNQIRQTRQLIKDLGKNHTILLSTHILPEVEMVCERVIIINKGKIVTDEKVENLVSRMRSGATVRVEAKGPGPKLKAAFEAISGVTKIIWHEKGGDSHEFFIASEKGRDVRPDIFHSVVAQSAVLLEMAYERVSLEDIFSQITLEEAKQ